MLYNKKMLDGYTMMHEHMTIDLSGIKNDPDTRLDCLEDTIEEMRALYQLGVRNILDVTNIGMGRNPEYIKKIEEETGIRILQSTGFYKDPFLPDIVESSTIEELANLMIKEIEIRIEDTGIKAVCIGEIGTSQNEMTIKEEKVFEAAVLAAKKTNALISTHTTLGTYAWQQVQFFLKRGIQPDRVVIGHVALAKDLNLIKKIIGEGFNIAFDTIGKNNYFPDDERIKFLMELEKENQLNHIVLSVDITRKSHFKKNGGIGYSYLLEEFVPKLRSAGMKEESINQMLIENPKRLLNR